MEGCRRAGKQEAAPNYPLRVGSEIKYLQPAVYQQARARALSHTHTHTHEREREREKKNEKKDNQTNIGKYTHASTT